MSNVEPNWDVLRQLTERGMSSADIAALQRSQQAAANRIPAVQRWIDQGAANATAVIGGGSAGGGGGDDAEQEDNAGKRDALASIRATFQRYGLPDTLATWAWDQLIAGKSEAEIMLDLYERPEFQARFPAIAEARRLNKPAISPAAYIEFEQTTRALARQAGLPEGFVDDDRVARWLVGGVSPREAETRIVSYIGEALKAPPVVREEMERIYGIQNSVGALAAYFADETKTLPLLERQFTASRIAGTSRQTGYGSLQQTEAERLAALGLSQGQTQEGFTTLAGSTELFDPLVGQRGDAISRERQLAAVFEGDAAARNDITKTGRQRAGVFEGGGGLAVSDEGVSGLGNWRR